MMRFFDRFMVLLGIFQLGVFGDPSGFPDATSSFSHRFKSYENNDHELCMVSVDVRL